MSTSLLEPDATVVLGVVVWCAAGVARREGVALDKEPPDGLPVTTASAHDLARDLLKDPDMNTEPRTIVRTAIEIRDNARDGELLFQGHLGLPAELLDTDERLVIVPISLSRGGKLHLTWETDPDKPGIRVLHASVSSTKGRTRRGSLVERIERQEPKAWQQSALSNQGTIHVR